MVFYPSQNNPSKPDGNSPNLPAFDLQAEKQRIGEGTEEIRQELLAIWQRKYSKAQIFPAKIASVSPELIKFLLSFKNTLFYNDLAKKFGFSAEQRDALPQIIWNISLAKNWYGLEALLQSEMKINSSAAGQITILINQNILFRAKELGEKVSLPKRFGDEKVDSGLESIPIQVALKKYPELGEQLITSERITLQSFPGPVRPSIKNWLAAYNFAVGYDRERSAIERTAYLFHNLDAKKLNGSEREKVSSLLRSYDENYPITVNKNTQQVVFPRMIPKTAPTPTGMDRFPASSNRGASSQGGTQAIQRPVPKTEFHPASPPATIAFRADNTSPSQQPYGSHGDGRSDAGRSSPSPNHFAQPAPKQAFPKSASPAFQAPPMSRPSAPTPPAKPETKEPPLVPKKEDADVHFTSPHTLPFEKDGQGPLQPHRITPMGINSQENRPEKSTQPVKNVINLKE